MRHIINAGRGRVSPHGASTFWTVIAVIGFVIRVILEMTDPNNRWNGGEQ